MPQEWVDSHIHLIDRARLRYSWLEAVSDEWAAILGNYKPLLRDFAAEEFLQAALPEGLTKIVHVEAAFGSDPVAETRWLQGEADRIGLPMAVIARADLASPDVGALLDCQMASSSFRGVRMLWGLANAPAEAFRRGFAALVDRDLIFEDPTTWDCFPILAGLAEDFPSARIVLGHCGMPLRRDPGYLSKWRRALDNLAAHKNVCCKISGLAMTNHDWSVDQMKTVVDAVVEAFGPDRAFMGSNWPVESLYFSSYGDLMATYRELIGDFPEEWRRALMSGTATRVFDI